MTLLAEGMPKILSIGIANPMNCYSQREIYDFVAAHVPMYRNPRIEQIFMSSDIDHRHFAFDLATLNVNDTADELHSRFEQNAVPLGKEAAMECLEKAGAGPADVDFIVAVTCTGYLCPGLSALLMKEMGMRDDAQRADLVGMGCAGAMPGLQRAFDFAKAYPGRKALVVTVEVCSACYYVDESLETVVGNAICGDGAAAALVCTEGPGPALQGFQALLEPSYLHTVGFQFKSGKLRIVLSKDIRDVAGDLAKKVIDRLLIHQQMSVKDVDRWIIHSGGRKVIDNIKDAVGLTEEQLVHSRRTLREFGNMSSPTVLFVLNETIEKSSPRKGDVGVMLAMGPGLAIEAGMLLW